MDNWSEIQTVVCLSDLAFFFSFLLPLELFRAKTVTPNPLGLVSFMSRKFHLEFWRGTCDSEKQSPGHRRFMEA